MQEAVIMDFASVSIEISKYAGGVLLAIVSRLAYDGSKWGDKDKTLKQNVCEKHDGMIEKIDQAIIGISEQKAFINKIFDMLVEITKMVNKIGKEPEENKINDKEKKTLSCLIIDDNENIVGITCRMIENLSDNRIKCIGTDNIIEAKKHLMQTTFDFIMIDYCLGQKFSLGKSGYTGYDFYKYIIDTFPKMKCIIYSGKSPDKIESEIADIFIEKPFTFEQILNKIDSVLK